MTTATRTSNFLVLGLGNLLMNDDAAGLQAAYELQKRYPDTQNFQIVDGGTQGLALLHLIGWADSLLLLDAVNIGEPPGTVVLIEGEDIDTVMESKVSPHQVGLQDLLATAELIGDRPATVRLIGIQAQSIEMEMTLSLPVEQGLQKMISHADLLIREELKKRTKN